MAKAAELIEEMIRYDRGDTRRINHTLKVYGFAKTIGEREGYPRDVQETLELAAVLHDIGIRESERKYGSSSGKYQELEGPAVALEMLSRCGVSPEMTGRICWLIAHHHEYGQIVGKDYQALVEADFLVNMVESEMKPEEIRSVREKIFRTRTGLLFLDCLCGEETK